MENNKTVDLMTIISKAVIILPLVIIIIALAIKFNSKKEIIQSQVTPTNIPIISTISPTATSGAKLNLQGPLSCSYQDKTSSLSAFIKNNQILVEYKKDKATQKYLVQDDCYYIWDKSKLIGEKKCGGIKQILNVTSLLLGSNIISLENIASYLPQTGTASQSLGINQTQINSILNSCEKKSVDDTLFTIPKGVRFTTTSK